ncbi:MAG: patatin-like phospholipase family protein [Alphaproteobacteria bacterium]
MAGAPKSGPIPRYETVALVLQGGGALGAYQAGVYQALHEAGIRPNWFAGISIGAVNAAIMAGNAPERRIARLREFWETVSRSPLFPADVMVPELTRLVPGSDDFRPVANLWSAASAIMGGQAGFFAPRMPPPWLHPPGADGATSFYDTAPLRATLERLIDFDRLNSGEARVSVGAVNVRSGNFVYFDSKEMPVGVEHVMASGALPPGFPGIEIGGEVYWDGGVVSNTPLAFVLESTPRRDTLAFQVDLWSARGTVPDTVFDVLQRQKDIQYSSRTRMVTDTALEKQRMRRVISDLIGKLPPELRKDPAIQKARSFGCDKVYNVVHLIYHSKAYELQSKDYEFSFASMTEHWEAGLVDARRTLANPRHLERPSAETGVVTHDVHRSEGARKT